MMSRACPQVVHPLVSQERLEPDAQIVSPLMTVLRRRPGFRASAIGAIRHDGKTMLFSDGSRGCVHSWGWLENDSLMVPRGRSEKEASERAAGADESKNGNYGGQMALPKPRRGKEREA